ncbi:MAG TPA: monovalent cation/H(+) antiporter subunit G [Tepidisphaeraceae bacterium]|nr:monovalent cation/H(+) antiporter subunit G [Tepidisphaeraceae bacterium]
MAHGVVLGILLGVAVLLTLLSALGLAVMRDPYQRLHYSAVIVSWASIVIAAAVWFDEKEPQTRIKVILVGLVLFTMNSVLTSETAKAVRVRQKGHWEPHAEEGIEVMGRKEPAGGHGAERDHLA